MEGAVIGQYHIGHPSKEEKSVNLQLVLLLSSLLILDDHEPIKIFQLIFCQVLILNFTKEPLDY